MIPVYSGKPMNLLGFLRVRCEGLWAAPWVIHKLSHSLDAGFLKTTEIEALPFFPPPAYILKPLPETWVPKQLGHTAYKLLGSTVGDRCKRSNDPLHPFLLWGKVHSHDTQTFAHKHSWCDEDGGCFAHRTHVTTPPHPRTKKMKC